tara:strand:+ start:14319 stop:16493 length:2175 start_codon:yes stop_codon:yes gene_type:complete
MTINFSNGRPVYQHRRSLSTGLNAEGQPTTDQIEQGEIAINLSTRKLYTKRPTVTRDSDGTSDILEVSKVMISGVKYRLPGFRPYGQQFQSGSQIRIISRRILDSDTAGLNVKLRIRQSGFLDSDNALNFVRDSDAYTPTFVDSDGTKTLTAITGSGRDSTITNGDGKAYKVRHIPVSKAFRGRSDSNKLKLLLHDSDGTTDSDITPVNAVHGSKFGGGVVDISFNIDSDLTSSEIATRIANAVNASAALNSMDQNIIAEIDKVNPSIVYIYGGDKKLEVEAADKFVQTTDHSITPLFKFVPSDSDTFFLKRDSDNDSDFAKRVEITFFFQDETTPRIAASGEVMETTTFGINEIANSPIYARKAITLKNMVGNIGTIDSDETAPGQIGVTENNRFKIRGAAFTGADEVVTLNAVAVVSSTPPAFDVENGSLWLEDNSSKTPRFDAVDSETHHMEVVFNARGSYSSATPDSEFSIPYGVLQDRTSADSDDRVLHIDVGDSEARVARKIVNLLNDSDYATRAGRKGTAIQRNSMGSGLMGVYDSDSDGSPRGTGYNYISVMFDSEHDSELFGKRIYLPTNDDSDGRNIVTRSGTDTDANFDGLVIEIINKQTETNRTFAGFRAAEIYFLDATLIDDPTAQTKALEMSSAERTEKNIVKHSVKPGMSNTDSDGSFRYAEWRTISSTSVLSPQSLSLSIAGQSFSSTQSLIVQDKDGLTVLSGQLLV